jgi:hypothetical protein
MSLTEHLEGILAQILNTEVDDDSVLNQLTFAGGAIMAATESLEEN